PGCPASIYQSKTRPRAEPRSSPRRWIRGSSYLDLLTQLASEQIMAFTAPD
ncbi:hypothetical protein M5D96_005589, partial [Drosophila gunungcola]